MSFKARAVLVVLWVVSLIAAATFARAQAFQFERLPQPVIISGSDIAYRVEGRIGANPAGRLLIRINGQWVEPVQNSSRPVPATQ
jgi:hypothetical protein